MEVARANHPKSIATKFIQSFPTFHFNRCGHDRFLGSSQVAVSVHVAAPRALLGTPRRRRGRRYRPRHRPCRAPSGCRRPPGAPCCGAARPTACWLAARTLRGPSPPAEGVRRRRRRPLRRCPSRPVEPPRAGTGGYINYYYVWSGSCMCMLKLILTLNKRIPSGKRL